MINLNEMKTKELKEMAKKLKIKDWWNLKKQELIDKIADAIGEETDRDPDYNIEEVLADEVETEVETEVEEVETEEAKVEEVEETEVKTVKKPSLKIKELTYNGETKTIKEWAAELEMPWPTLYDRVNRNGWSVEDAIETPLGKRRPKHS